MLQKFLPALAAFALCLLCLCPGKSPAADYTAWKRDVADLINEERQRQGLRPLTVDPALEKAADVRAGELLRQRNGTRPDGRKWSTALQDRNLRYARATETYSRRQDSWRVPEVFVAAKLNFPHLVGPLYTSLGVGIRPGKNGAPVWELLLLEPSDAGPNFARSFLNLLNAERKQRGLPPLAASKALERIAFTRSADILTHFSNKRPNGAHWYTLLEQNNIQYSIVSDWYVRGHKTPRAAAQAFIKKDTPVLYSEEYTEAGVWVRSGSDSKTYLYLVAITPKGGTSGKKAPAPASRAANLSEYPADVLRLVNAERRKSGLAPLAPLAVLDTIADVRAKELITRFSHSRPNGSAWGTLLDQYKVPWRANGENIAAGQKNPVEVMGAWMASPGHRQNILNKTFTHLGVGVRADAKGRIQWVQTFLTPK